MSNWIRKNRFHILIWVVMIAFVILAPRIQAEFFIRDGRPIQLNGELPAETSQLMFYVDRVEVYDDQGILYNLRGWAFSTVDKNIPPSQYQREIVLISEHGNYVFSTRAERRKDVQNHFSDLGMNLDMPGFSVLINKNIIENGKYSIGIIFRHLPSGSAYYINTFKILVRTPNSIKLEDR